MPRVVSLYLPSWPTDRLRRTPGAAAPPPEVPLALIGREGRRRVVLAADALALRTGVRIGMPATQAKALVAGLVVLDADPAADAEALERLALWVLRRYAPIASADPPDGLVDRHHGRRPPAWRRSRPCSANWSSAWRPRGSPRGRRWPTAGARRTPSRAGWRDRRWLCRPAKARRCCDRCRLRRCVCPATSSMACGCSASIASASWPRNPARRWRCASAQRSAGGSTRPWAGLPSRSHRSARRNCRGPPRLRRADRRGRDHRALHRQACRRACARRSSCAASARGVSTWSSTASIPGSRRSGSAPRCPARDARHLTRLLCDRIETIDPGFGIELMSLTATLAEPMVRKQTVSDLVEEQTPDVSDLIDTLSNRVGEQLLYRFAAGGQRRAGTLGPARRARCRRTTAPAGRITGRARRACCAIPSRSRPWRCCRIIRPRPSPGAVSAAG